MQRIVVAKTLILSPDGKLLMVRRSQTDPKRPGDWDYPGGMVDPGEDMTEAAIREVQEEVGMKVALDDLQLVFSETTMYDDKDVHVVRLLYATKLNADQEITLSYEHDHYEWMDPKEAANVFEHPVWGKGLKHAIQYNLLP